MASLDSTTYLCRNYIVVDVSVQISIIYSFDYVYTNLTPRYDEQYSGRVCAAA
jgi:hypothetical protein